MSPNPTPVPTDHRKIKARRHRSYGERPTISQERHNLSASGAAHHLMRLGAGLAPLPPLAPTGEEQRP
jgi:hypothetical protein